MKSVLKVLSNLFYIRRVTNNHHEAIATTNYNKDKHNLVSNKLYSESKAKAAADMENRRGWTLWWMD